MIKKKSEKIVRKLEIDLTGPDGNAFVLLAYAKVLCRDLDIDYKGVRSQMIEGDYKNLVKVFEKNFGDHVILYI